MTLTENPKVTIHKMAIALHGRDVILGRQQRDLDGFARMIEAAGLMPVRCTKCRTRFFAPASDEDVTCDECGKIAESYAALHARIEEARAMTSAGVEGFFDEE